MSTIHLIVRLAVALSIVAVAQAQIPHEHGSADEQAMHEKFYAKWLRPDQRMNGQRWSSCCSLEDCFPTQFRKVNGQWFAQDRDGAWREVPDETFEHNQPDPVESPDGRGHVCITPGAHAVLCAVLGGDA